MNLQNKPLTLQFLFFDGEEAFKRWTATDSIYGSRHLANIWKNTPYEFGGVRGNTLDRIDIFMLLDLLGARNPNINSSQRPTEVCTVGQKFKKSPGQKTREIK